MKIIQHKTHIDFLRYRTFFIGVSLLLLGMSFYFWFSLGEKKYGVDFRGGTELLVSFQEDVAIDKIREAFEKAGIADPTVQAFEGSAREFSLRLSVDEGTPEGKQKVKTILQSLSSAGHEIRKEDFVGPVIGEQIRRSGLYAVIGSLIAMFIYVTLRFEWRFSLGAILALFHDSIIAVGFCLATGRPFSADILAACLTIVGYSVNDTIVIFDRIRENIIRWRKSASKSELDREGSREWLVEIMNLSLNETLSRSILTSLTVFFVVSVLFFVGGGAVSDLAFALMIGTVVGVYSSVFIACPIVLAFERKK